MSLDALDKSLQLAADRAYEWTAAVIVFTMLYPLQVAAFAINVLILFLVIYLWRTRKRWERKQLLRGSRMRRKDRARWRQRHALHVLTEAFEKEYLEGRFTEREAGGYIRLFGRTLEQEATSNALRALQALERKTATKAEKPSAEEQMKLRDFIRLKLGRWKVYWWLYKPMNIPGPKPPQEVKKNELPIIRAKPTRGFLAQLKTR